MKIKIINLSLVILFAAICFNACDDTLIVSEIDKIIIPDSNVSYSKYIHPVLQVKCATSGCHDQSRAGGLDLTTHTNTTLDPNVVFPGSPELSSLVLTIKAQSGYPAMPPVGYPPLTLNQINGIETWIKEGAENN